MTVRKKHPPSVRKLLVQVMKSAELLRADFSDLTSSAWLPTSEAQVNSFIAKRTTLWRNTALLQPLQTAITLIDEGKQ